MKPVIGIAACGSTDNRQFVTEAYIEAVSRTGGIPLILPILDDAAILTDYLQICDGFLFCGGRDITPLLFGEELLTDRGGTDLFTDRFHLALMQKVLHAKRPVLAICRGMQVMNLALGGSIYQDLSLRPSPTLQHMQISGSRKDPCHKITVSQNSMLSDFLGTHANVNSFHHQCLHFIPPQIRPVATASDGVVEAIEIPGHPFALGVQWHPEVLLSLDPGMKKLFSTLTERAGSCLFPGSAG